MRNRLLGLVAGLALVVAAAIGPASTASAQGDTLINVGSPPAPFSANKQNEPAVAVDACTSERPRGGSERQHRHGELRGR